MLLALPLHGDVWIRCLLCPISSWHALQRIVHHQSVCLDNCIHLSSKVLPCPLALPLWFLHWGRNLEWTCSISFCWPSNVTCRGLAEFCWALAALWVSCLIGHQIRMNGRPSMQTLDTHALLRFSFLLAIRSWSPAHTDSCWAGRLAALLPLTRLSYHWRVSAPLACCRAVWPLGISQGALLWPLSPTLSCSPCWRHWRCLSWRIFSISFVWTIPSWWIPALQRRTVSWLPVVLSPNPSRLFWQIPSLEHTSPFVRLLSFVIPSSMSSWLPVYLQ